MEKLTTLAHKTIEEVLKPGDLAVDATIGNGFDTAFLARIVGEKGKVFAFDIQNEAIKRTKEFLEKENLLYQVNLLNTCHSLLSDYVNPNSAKAIMFNLGFLPRSNREVITSPQTTKTAIVAGIDALMDEGVMTVIVYRGHKGGAEEATAVSEVLKNSQKYEECVNELSPIMYIFRKN